MGAQEPPPAPRRLGARPGRWAVTAMAVLAVLAALANLLYHRHLGQRPAEHWGPRASALIAGAPQAVLCRLGPGTALATQGGPSPDSASATIPPAGVLPGNLLAGYPILAAYEVTSAPGFSHVRRALLQTPTFLWHAPPLAADQPWHWALCFGQPPQQARLLFTADAQCVALIDGRPPLRLSPAAAAAVRAFFVEQEP